MTHGRPLRFLAITMGGWTAMRVLLLWPTIDSVPALIRAVVPPVDAATRSGVVASTPPPAPLPLPRTARIDDPPGSPLAVSPRSSRPSEPVRIALAMAVTPGFVDAVPGGVSPLPTQPPPLRPASLAHPPRRLAGSIWGIVRAGNRGALPGGQLGGSQIGARLTYALGSARRIALSARVSAPLRGRGGELGVGVDWQPTAWPIHVIAEQRIALDRSGSGSGSGSGGGGGHPALMVVGGIDPHPLAAGFRLDAYGQAGAIVRGGLDGFVDGGARVTRPTAWIGGMGLDLGAGLWGGAQRGAARLDIGPSLAITVPVDRHAMRITVDWRQRIAGAAHPGSGPALSIGGDF